jgi:hypothetical protein
MNRNSLRHRYKFDMWVANSGKGGGGGGRNHSESNPFRSQHMNEVLQMRRDARTMGLNDYAANYGIPWSGEMIIERGVKGNGVTYNTTWYLDIQDGVVKNPGMQYSVSGPASMFASSLACNGCEMMKAQQGYPWHYTSDYTKNGLVISQGNGRYVDGTWTEDPTGTVLAGAFASAAAWYVTSGWGLSSGAEAIIAGVSGGAGLDNFRYERRMNNFVVDQTVWYGKVTHNIFTGEIVAVQTTGVVSMEANLVAFRVFQERIIFEPTNAAFANRSISSGANFQPFSQPVPVVGANIYR